MRFLLAIFLFSCTPMLKTDACKKWYVQSVKPYSNGWRIFITDGKIEQWYYQECKPEIKDGDWIIVVKK